MDPSRNPYRPSAGSRPPVLAGRDSLIDAFGVTMRQALQARPSKSPLCVGLRGVGKTVLLNVFMEIAQAERLRIGFIEASEDGAFSTRLAGKLRSILLALRSEGVVPSVVNALKVLRAFTFTLPDGVRFNFDVEAAVGSADSGILDDDLTDLLVAVGEAVRDKGTGLVLAVDELQYLTEPELGALVAAIHRTTQLNLPVVLAGAGLPQIPGMLGNAKSYAERLFDFTDVGALSASDAEHALVGPADALDVGFDSAAADFIVNEAKGYPYFLQEWGKHTWLVAEGPNISLVDAKSARAGVVAQLDENFFRVRFDRLTPAEKDYLAAMAKLGPGPHRSGDIATRLGIKVTSAAPRRSNLIKKGMIYSPDHGDTAFTVPLFDEFMKRAMLG